MHAASHRRASLDGLYVVLDPAVYTARDLVPVLKDAAAVGVRLFQYRDKTASMQDAYRTAVRLRDAAGDAGASLIINDRCDLAMAVDADGVHLGQDDLPCAHARRLLGPAKIIGLSTHSGADVEAAAGSGADYLGFGPIFATGSKGDHEPVVGLEGLRDARRRTALPIFAIGGITVEAVGAVRQAGADGVAVISAVARAPDVGAVVRAFLAGLR